MLRMWLSVSHSPPHGSKMSQTLFQVGTVLAFAKRFIIEVGLCPLSLVKVLTFRGFGVADS
jgi:hypothetical protein